MGNELLNFAAGLGARGRAAESDETMKAFEKAVRSGEIPRTVLQQVLVYARFLELAGTLEVGRLDEVIADLQRIRAQRF